MPPNGPNTSIVKDSFIEISYKWTTGKAVGRFFTEFRDHQKIWGLKCSCCKKVYVPPQDLCEACFVEMNDWLELTGTGALESYTIVHEENPNQPVPPPYAIGLIRLDGADTQFMHLVGGVELDRIECGLRVKPVWKKKPEGNILDIVHFEPV